MKIWSIKYLLVLGVLVKADVYLHNPRGSNNRLDEDGRERRNANRLFDSQNNNRGGYNVGSLYYYSGSVLPIEWTNQHSCGGPNNHCEMVIQYMCAETLRDGASTSTIPENLMQCEGYNCNMDTQYGMHENYEYYLKCKLRQRNEGLFTADQNVGNHLRRRGKRGINLKRDRARNTRQNPNGNRRGYECPEERDYYPYWHPSPWRDIAVLTNNASRCEYYKRESENVRGRHECVIDRSVLIMGQNIVIPNNEQDCLDFRYPANEANGTRGVWMLMAPHGIPAPECREADFSRDNHLGNGVGGYPNVFNWTVPHLPHERCAIRIRYNVSTQDYEAWDDVDASNNKPSEFNNKAANINLAPHFGLKDEETASDRGYEFKNNPNVQIFTDAGNKMNLQLAINTAQYGRTFEDRSHRFAIRPRPADIEGDIYNLNVRGKRGNIVQVYPAVEYDFVPNSLHIPRDSYVHIQWTGSNTNPRNNDGQGLQGTDRSNMVLQRVQAYAEGTGLAYVGTEKYGHWGRSYPEQIANTTLLGFSKTDLLNLALLSPGQFGGELSELDDAGTYFDLGPRKVTQTGVYHYLCTRNNNFSNRSQKGRIICDNVKSIHRPIGSSGGNLSAPNNEALVSVEAGDFQGLQKLEMQVWPIDHAEQKISQAGQSSPVGDNYAGPFIVLHPEQRLTAPDKYFSMEMSVDDSSGISVYRTTSTSFSSWTKIDSEVDDGRVRFQAQEGGTYVAVKEDSTAVIVGAVIGTLLVVLVLVVGMVVYFRKNPQTVVRIKRSFGSQV